MTERVKEFLELRNLLIDFGIKERSALNNALLAVFDKSVSKEDWREAQEPSQEAPHTKK